MDIFKIIFLASILDQLGAFLTLIIMNPYLIRIGGSPIGVGIVSSLTSLISFLWLPVAGSLSDSVGRKSILLICIFMALIGNLFTVFTSTLAFIYIALVLKAFGAPIGTLLKSIMADLAKSKDEAIANFNKTQGFMKLFQLVSLVAGGILSEYSIHLLFVISVSLYAANFVLSIFAIPGAKKVIKKSQPQSRQQNYYSIAIKEVSKAAKNLKNLDWDKYWDLFSINILGHCAITMFFPNMGIVLYKSFGKGMQFVSYIVAMMGITSIATNLLINKIKALYKNDNANASTRLMHAVLLQALALITVGLTSNIQVFVAFLIPLFIGRTILETTLSEVLLIRTTDKDKGSVMGAFDSNLSFASILSPLISGVIMQFLGENFGVIFASIPLIAAAVIIQKNKRVKID